MNTHFKVFILCVALYYRIIVATQLNGTFLQRAVQNFFQNFFCTIQFIQDENLSQKKNSNDERTMSLPLSKGEGDFDLLSRSCVSIYCVSLQSTHAFSTELTTPSLFWKIFSVIKHSYFCTAHVPKSSKLENKIRGYQKYQQPFKNIASNIFHPLWSSIMKNDDLLRPRVAPDFIITFVKANILPSSSGWNPKLYAQLPGVLHNSKIILFESIDSEQIQWYVSCFTCDKSDLISWLDIKNPNSDLEKISAIVIFVPHFSNEQQLIFRESKLNNFGVSLENNPNDEEAKKCSKSLLNGTPQVNSLWMNEAFKTCVLQMFLSYQNSNSSFLNPYLGDSIVYFNSAYFIEENYEEIGVGGIIIPFGALFDGLRFSVILSKNEDGAGKIKMDLNTIISPLSYEGWFLLVTNIIILSVLLWVTTIGVEEGRYWWFWIFAVLVEQEEGDMRKWRNTKNFMLLLGWMLGSFFFRNLYMSSMYSYLTKSPGPERIPKSMEQLFKQQIPMPILAEWGLSSNILQILKIQKIFQSSEKDDYEKKFLDKVHVINTENYMTDFVMNVSQGLSVRCESFANQSLFNFKPDLEQRPSCLTSGRFAMLHNVIGDRKLHSPRYLKPILEILGKRKVIENLNEQPILTQPILWFLEKRFFFLEQFQSMVASLSESGIFQKLTEGYDSGEQREAINEVNEKGNFENTWNVYTYSSQVISGDTSVTNSNVDGNDRSHEAINLEEFLVMVMLLVYMLGFCVLVKFFEVLIYHQ